MHNFSSGILTEDEAPGVPEGTGFTPKHTSSKETLIHSRSPDFRLYSPVFGRHSEFPVRNTQEGENLSPNLIWVGHKQQAVEEFVLVLEDMDSGTGQQPFVHWLMYRIPANVSELPEGVVPRAGVAEVNGALHGLNSYGLLGYRGPMPPVGDGWHRYRFRLLALEAPIHDIRPGLTWPEVYDKIREHIIEVTDCMVRYQRQREYRATG